MGRNRGPLPCPLPEVAWMLPPCPGDRPDSGRARAGGPSVLSWGKASMHQNVHYDARRRLHGRRRRPETEPPRGVLSRRFRPGGASAATPKIDRNRPLSARGVQSVSEANRLGGRCAPTLIRPVGRRIVGAAKPPCTPAGFTSHPHSGERQRARPTDHPLLLRQPGFTGRSRPKSPFPRRPYLDPGERMREGPTCARHTAPLEIRPTSPHDPPQHPFPPHDPHEFGATCYPHF